MNDYYQCWAEAEDAYRSRPGLWRNLMDAVVYHTHRAWHKEDAQWRRTIPGTYVDEIEHMLKWYGFRVLASADLTEGYDSDYRWLIRTPGGRMLTLTDGGCSCWEPIRFQDFLTTGYETGRQEIADWVFNRWSSRYDIRWHRIMIAAILAETPYASIFASDPNPAISAGVWARVTKGIHNHQGDQND